MERAARKDIPAGAVVLDRQEALGHLYKLVQNHQPVRDVLFLKYGGVMAGVAASITGMAALQHFRRNLGLRKEAQISSNLVSIFLPCMTTFVYHYLFVTPPILLQERYCKVCLELKSGGIQASLGFVWPVALGMLSATMTAARLGVNMPTAKEPIKLIKFGWYLANKGNGPMKFSGLLVFSVLGAAFLVHAEEAQVLTFRRRIQIRKELDRD